MPDFNSIINLGDLTKPATVLIEKVSDAIGGACRPGQIRRVAKAEAEAAVIRAQGDAAATAIERRAMMRVLEEEALHQENIEAITMKALPHLKAEAKPGDIDDDWIRFLFGKCRIVSDTEMQDLWARVLAGEANAPGAFSKRTISFVECIATNDARWFSNLSRFIWHIQMPTPIIFNWQDPIYQDNGIRYDYLLHLESIGLLKFDMASPFAMTSSREVIDASYCGHRVQISPPRDSSNVKYPYQLSTGAVTLTQTGEELSSVCDRKPVDGYIDYVLDTWRKKGVKIIEPIS